MVVLIVGLIMLVLGVVGFIIWGPEFLGVLKGSLPPIFALAGLAAIAVGISSLKDKMAAVEKEAEPATEAPKEEAKTEGSE